MTVQVAERKDAFVKVTYVIDGTAKRNATIAVKITDMLGEEMLLTREV